MRAEGHHHHPGDGGLDFASAFQTNYNGVAKSTLKFVPSVEDDGRFLTCKAENLALDGAEMDDQWHIKVHCKCAKKVPKAPHT